MGCGTRIVNLACMILKGFAAGRGMFLRKHANLLQAAFVPAVLVDNSCCMAFQMLVLAALQSAVTASCGYLVVDLVNALYWCVFLW